MGRVLRKRFGISNVVVRVDVSSVENVEDIAAGRELTFSKDSLDQAVSSTLAQRASAEVLELLRSGADTRSLGLGSLSIQLEGVVAFCDPVLVARKSVVASVLVHSGKGFLELGVDICSQVANGVHDFVQLIHNFIS